MVLDHCDYDYECAVGGVHLYPSWSIGAGCSWVEAVSTSTRFPTLSSHLHSTCKVTSPPFCHPFPLLPLTQTLESPQSPLLVSLFIKSGRDPDVHIHPTCQLPFLAHFPHLVLLHLQGAKAWATCALVQQAKWPMTGLPNHTFAFSRIFPRSLLPSQLKICLQKTPCPTVSGGVVSAVFSLAEIGDVWYKSGALMAPCRCALLSVSRLPWEAFVKGPSLSAWLPESDSIHCCKVIPLQSHLAFKISNFLPEVRGQIWRKK